MAASGQYFGVAQHMCSLKIAPLVGGLVIADRLWERIPENQKKEMMAAVDRVSKKLAGETERLEQKAIDTMKKNGLVIHEAPADSLAKWKEAAAKGMDEMVGKLFSREIYDRLQAILEEYRRKP